MVKVRYTRKQRAQELLKRITRGPASLEYEEGCRKEDYDIWARSWIISELRDLIPELRKSPDGSKP